MLIIFILVLYTTDLIEYLNSLSNFFTAGGCALPRAKVL